jgi:hypothetical protein
MFLPIGCMGCLGTFQSLYLFRVKFWPVLVGDDGMDVQTLGKGSEGCGAKMLYTNSIQEDGNSIQEDGKGVGEVCSRLYFIAVDIGVGAVFMD